jgi:hypothetical protein
MGRIAHGEVIHKIDIDQRQDGAGARLTKIPI